MTVEIKLTQGKVALIDDEDFENVSQHKWCAAKTHRRGFYAITSIKNGKNMSLHRLIMCTSSEMQIDHIDGNGLNCQRHNMRFATHSDNMKNRRMNYNSVSGFKGVNLYKRTGKYRASIRSDGINYHLGYFDSPEEAAHVYDMAARKLHGEFASLNFLGQD